MRGKDLHVESEAQDMYSAIDILMDKLDRQVLKHKDRIQDHHRTAVRDYDGATEVA
jgi:putative sigma-54 modulation protein